MEIWKEIILNEQTKYRYFVSNNGNFVRKLIHNDAVVKEYNMKPIFNKKNGYYSVTINGQKRYAHRLVAQYFCEGYDEKLQVNHINGNKSDNRALNLEWCTAKQNMKHASKNNLINRDSEKRKKQCAINAKIGGEKQKRQIVQLTENLEFVSKFDSIQEASKILKINDSNISRSLKTHKHLAGGYRFCYLFEYENGNYKTYPNIYSCCKKVVMLNKNKEQVKVFKSRSEAEEYGLELLHKTGKKKAYRGSVRKSLKNGTTYLGFYWEYDEN